MIFATSLSLSTSAQLKIGDYLPAERLQELKRMASADFPLASEPIKLYLLDFWSIWCGACIAGFPKAEGLQYQFRNEIRILSINPWNKKEEIDEFFAKQQRARNNKGKSKATEKEPKELKKDKNGRVEVMVYVPSVTTPRMTSLPASNGDSSWLDIFAIKGVPHYVWMNDSGRILSVTGPGEVSAGNINHFLKAGELPKMNEKFYPSSFNLGKRSLMEEWGEHGFQYHENNVKIRDFYEGPGSSVFGYSREAIVDPVKNTIRYSYVNIPVADLYKAAWAMAGSEHERISYTHGRTDMLNGDTIKYKDVLNERMIWDVSIPQYYLGPVAHYHVSSHMPGFNDWSFRAKFCVEMELPLNRKTEASQVLLKALNQYFYQKFGILAKTETQERPCLVIKRGTNYRNQTRAAESSSVSYEPNGRTEKYTNMPFNNIFLDYLPYRIDHNPNQKFWTTNSNGTHYMPRLNRNFILINQSNITGNINLVLHTVPDDVTDPVEAMNIRLRGTGLYVEKEMRMVNMMTISDRTPFPLGLR